MSDNDYSLASIGDLSEDEIFDLLRKWRESNERKSREINKIWTCRPDVVIENRPNEKYLIYEQIILATLDCNNSLGAIMVINTLDKQFPRSLRVMRYKAMVLESDGRYEDALQVLDEIIKVDETNAPARKRRVAVMKAQGLIGDAIKELVDYLKKYSADMEAWQELSELYLQIGEYSRAVYCVEELLLHQPHSHLLHQRVADIRYTMGGVENLELAKSYYCQALKLNANNMRALLGLILVTNNLLGHYKPTGCSKRKEAWKLSRWAQSEVTKKQREMRGADDNALTNMMLSLSISE
ncbi:unnamed protein product [Leptosia nina]|uniref:ER membrane protein complex subunit 2 n=1 Tax=Leptosia nina TaxID=320188 RepID=A0AAV1J5W4_9NEOP